MNKSFTPGFLFRVFYGNYSVAGKQCRWRFAGRHYTQHRCRPRSTASYPFRNPPYSTPLFTHWSFHGRSGYSSPCIPGRLLAWSLSIASILCLPGSRRRNSNKLSPGDSGTDDRAIQTMNSIANDTPLSRLAF